MNRYDSRDLRGYRIAHGVITEIPYGEVIPDPPRIDYETDEDDDSFAPDIASNRNDEPDEERKA